MDARAELQATVAELQRRATFTPRTLWTTPVGTKPWHGVLHERGLAFTEDKAKRKAACCGRRAAKTTGVGIELLTEHLRPPYAHQLYATLSLKNAKRLVWPVLKRLNLQHRLGGVPNDSEGYMVFPRLVGEPTIFLGGAKDASEIDKIRGYEGGFKRAVVDECQAVRPLVLRDLLDEVIEPALMDYDGTLVVCGTPGPVPAGIFYEITQGEQASGWKQHHWTMLDNPFMSVKSGKPVQQLLDELMSRRRWTPDNPTFLREYRGLWVQDEGALAFHYDADRNACAPQSGPEPGWTYILAFDIGYEDSDAIAVLGWPEHDRVARLVAWDVRSKQTITQLGDRLQRFHATWRPIRTVGDLGALGKKIGAELVTRWGIPVEAADKTRKAEHITLLDDALRTGTFLAPPDSPFAQDAAIVQWDSDKRAQGELVLADEPHSDICDSVLYGYRHCLAFLEQDKPATPPRDPARDVEESWRRYEEQVEHRNDPDWLGDPDD